MKFFLGLTATVIHHIQIYYEMIVANERKISDYTATVCTLWHQEAGLRIREERHLYSIWGIQ